MLIGVTGAEGFVGSHLVQRARESGMSVQAIRHAGLDSGAWRRELRGFDTVVHLANRAHSRASASGVDRDVEAMKVLLAAAASEEVSRIIYVSSVKAAARALPDALESNHSTAYAHGKRRMEALLQHQAVPFVVLRPCLVHGVGMKGNLATLVRAIRAGVPMPVRGCENRRSMLWIRDLCSAILGAAVRPGCIGEILEIVHPQPLSTEQIINFLAVGVGRAPRFRQTPPATVLKGLRHVPGVHGPAKSLWGSLVSDGLRSSDLLGLTFSTSLEETLSAAASAVMRR